MKRSWIFRSLVVTQIFLVLLSLTMSSCGTSTPSPSPTPQPTSTPAPLTLEAGVLSIGIDKAWPPFQYRDEVTGEGAGFDAELGKLIAAKLGLEPKVVADDWLTVQAMVRGGQIDVLMSFTPTEERALVFDFSQVYLKTGTAVIVRPDAPYQKISDLYEKPAAVESGDKALQQAIGEHYTHIRMMKTDSVGDSLQALQDGKVEAAVISREAGLYVAHQMGLEYRLIYNVVGDTENTVGMRKGNQALLDQINAALTALKADGSYDRLYNEWFGE